MTLDEWQKNPALASALADDLLKPHIALAMEIVARRSPAYTNRNLSFSAIAGRGDVLAGQILGFEMALAFFREMALPAEEAPKPLLSTYGIVDPSQATE